MTTETLTLLEYGLILLGIIGCVVPVLPGLLLVYAAILVQHFFDVRETYPTWLLIVLGLIVLLVMLAQYVIPIWGTKKFGASKWAVRGSIVGLLIGIFTSFLGPFGILFGPFLGAVLGELLGAKKTLEKSLKAGLGAVLGMLASNVMELMVALAFAGVFVWFQYN